ncbi:restriction endonuclease subunit S [Tabrizicola sp. M-4]|uniref:restriction endonuclease subunit S n=1 Tax=Tabrizicola sp. M-4 TaxID=3055847 RepID=UPI003DA832C5
MSFVARPGNSPTWADDLPNGWTADWVKWSVAFASTKPTDEDTEKLPYISNEDIASWTGKMLKEAPEPADKEGRVFQRDDVLFNKLRPYLAKVYHADFDGISSGELLNLRSSDRVLPRFLFHVLSSSAFIDTINAETFGTKMPRADWETVGHQPLPLPDLDTQRRIAGYLDDKTARIDALIEKKRALLDRLAEKRQALITRAVTRGLNPSAPLKDSGIDWLGKVPAHWEVKKLKYLTPKVSVGIVVTPANWYAEEGTLALRGLNIRPMGFDLQETRLISDEGHEFHAKSQLHEGDLVSVRTGDPGTTAVVTEEFDGCNCIDLVIIRRPVEMLPRFLGWFLNSSVAKVQYQLGSEGALQAHFNVDTSKETLVAVPSVDEQSAIVDHLEASLQAHDEAVTKITSSVEKLTEYRAALVTAAVTGKIKALLVADHKESAAPMRVIQTH